jgi:AcrR family transcriptional regulator
MATAPTGTRRRGTPQAERRAQTRAALLDATIESLVTHGYARTTTGRIAELAGVSRGAQLSYFASRSELLIAAVAHLSEKRIAEFTARVGARSPSLEECLDALWAGVQAPLFDAALELWVAARTDPELRTAMLRFEREIGGAIFAAAESALGDAARRPGFGEDLLHALAVVRGVALLQVTTGASPRTIERQWAHAREQLLQLLGGTG